MARKNPVYILFALVLLALIALAALGVAMFFSSGRIEREQASGEPVPRDPRDR